MKKIFYSIAFLTTIISFSQNTTKLSVVESAEFQDRVKSGEVLSMHTSPSGVTGVIRNSKKYLLFDVFDESMNRMKNMVIPKDKNEECYGDLSLNSTMKIFTVFSPTRNERIVYCHEFNINDGLYKKTELFKVSVEKNQSIFSGRNKRETGFAISPSGNYFVVSTDNIKKNSNSYTVHVYDTESLQLIYKKLYQENEEKFYQANDLTIDDDANVYSLGKLFLDGRSQKKGGKANYDFVLNKITSSDIVSTTVNFKKDEHISSLIISNINNQIKLMGFYSEERAGQIKGALIFNVDTENFQISQDKSFRLPEAVYKDLYNEDKAKRKKDESDELSSYYVDYVLNDNKGNTYLLAEKFFVTSVYVSNGMNGGYWQTVYHYNDVLVLKLNKEGNLDWGRSIFKRANSPS